jgi:hypothetical protein
MGTAGGSVLSSNEWLPFAPELGDSLAYLSLKIPTLRGYTWAASLQKTGGWRKKKASAARSCVAILMHIWRLLNQNT